MARRAIPIGILKGRKTARPDRHGTEKEQVKLESKLPKMPRVGRKYFLGKEGRKEWKRITKLLEAAHVLTEADRTVLTQYCLLYEIMLEDPKKFQAAQHTQLRLCQVELGLTPSARAKLRSQ